MKIHKGSKKWLTIASLLLLIVTGITYVPSVTAGTARYTILGPTGVPTNPQCAPDNNYEATRPEGDVMFFPNRGCQAAYDLHQAGIPHGHRVRVVQITF